jgi:hypothetical protein
MVAQEYVTHFAILAAGIDSWGNTWATCRWHIQQVRDGGDQGCSERQRVQYERQRVPTTARPKGRIYAGFGFGFGVASCNAMDAEHMLMHRIGVLSGSGADERITIK